MPKQINRLCRIILVMVVYCIGSNATAMADSIGVADFIRDQQLVYVERSYRSGGLEHFSDEDLRQFIQKFPVIKKQIALNAEVAELVSLLKKMPKNKQQAIYAAAVRVFTPTWSANGAINSSGQTDAGQKAEKMIANFIVTHVQGRVNGSLAAPYGNLPEQNWELVFADEFNTANSEMLNSEKWNFDLGATGWGNEELQYYSNRPANAKVSNGFLIITANKQKYLGSNYTSARINTKGKAAWTNGRFEIRAKLPSGKGLWPAIWLLPERNAYGDWRKNGEIDIAESIGSEPDTLYGTCHYFYNGEHVSAANKLRLPGTNLAQDFHVYGIEWDADWIRYTFDGKVYASFKSAKVFPDSNYRPFDQKFYLLINVAVGGTWPGMPDGNTIFPQRMYVDYVRVYQLH